MSKVVADAAQISLFAHELQLALGLPVEVGNFIASDDITRSNILPTPCSIVGVQPFATGGTRRLILNASSPLVARCAGLCSLIAESPERHAALTIGTAMLETGNWPMLDLDSPVPTSRWNRVLNSGPMTYFVCPRPLVPAQQKANGFHVFAINYKRMVGRMLRESKDLKTWQDDVETIGDRLVARDDALTLELASMLESSNLRTTVAAQVTLG
jgi:hypothetical protein